MENNYNKAVIRHIFKKISDKIRFQVEFPKCYYGTEIKIYSIDGNISCLIYWYDDDPLTIYMSNLFVCETKRRQGIANVMLHVFEKVALIKNADYVALAVRPNTWQVDWYQSRGFSVWAKETYIGGQIELYWLRKRLKGGE